MNDKKLIKLAGATLIMVVLAVIVSIPGGRSSDSVAANTPLIQGINTKDIAVIEASGVGKVTRLVKTDNGFVVESRENYPALYSEVNSLIVNCLDIKVSDFVTSNPDNFADLQVMEANADRVVKFINAEGKLITGVIIGKKDQVSGRTYVRKLPANENELSKVYLADRVAWVYTNPISYLEKRLLQCERSDIASVKVTTTDGSYSIVGIVENETVKPILQNIPEGRNVKQADVEKVFDAATNITFDDVQRAESVNEPLKYQYSFVVTSTDQTEMTLNMAKVQVAGTEKYYLTCSGKYLNTEFMEKVRAGNLSVSSDKEAMAQADLQLQTYQSIRDFNARHQGWVYTMELFNANKLIKNLSELLEEIPKPEAEPVQN